jgi:hypothetical protein
MNGIVIQLALSGGGGAHAPTGRPRGSGSTRQRTRAFMTRKVQRDACFCLQRKWMTGAMSRGWKSITSFHSSHTSLASAVAPIVNLLPYLFFLWKPFFFWGNLTEFPMTKIYSKFNTSNTTP